MNGSEHNAFSTYYHRPERDGKILTLDRLKYYYTSTNGRISRIEYLAATVTLYLLLLVIGFVLTMFCTASLFSANLFTVIGTVGFAWLFYAAFALAATISAFVAGAKRAHDRNKSGWFVLLYFVPILSLWPFVELYFLPGTAGDNLYGNDPLVRFGAALTSPPHPQSATASQGTAMAETSNRPWQQKHYSEPSPCNPQLLGTEGEYSNATIPLDATGIVMGRDASRCNLVLTSAQVSRVHARVTFLVDQGRFQVEDLGSSNGVFVGKERVSGKQTLASGQSFRLGQNAATFTVRCG